MERLRRWATTTAAAAALLASNAAAIERRDPIDVRALLQQAGLIGPPTERMVPEGEEVELVPPIQVLKDQLVDVIDAYIESRRETLVPPGSEVDLQPPVEQLFGAFAKGMRREEEVPSADEGRQAWSQPLEELLDGDSLFVDPADEASYVTVTLQRPLGIQFVENSKRAGSGIQINDIQPGSNAYNDGTLQIGYQLLVAGGLPVYGLPLEDAIRPIVETTGPVRFTFFTGSAQLFYGAFGPSAAWLSAFLRKLRVAHLAWAWREGLVPQGNRTWAWALELLEDFQASGRPLEVEATSSAYVAVLEACQQASQWEPALKLLGRMRQLDLQASSQTL
eukprot:TRINITY_DN30211_c0_g1_i3.p1 TRINITY_DN30211_c0_g1~~TRINITY_DN30211_c0_g1_i3.p1  ORF type:complete len:335 (-),score=75.56 TRINITY_DN30211_c0_g1_i3:267-1271(-)